MSLYNADGLRQITSVSGSSRTGLYSVDGTYNGVINDGSTIRGLYHPCGAFNIVIVTDSKSPAYATNGSLNVIANSSGGYSPTPAGAVTIPPSSGFLLKFDGTSFLLQTDAVSKIQLAAASVSFIPTFFLLGF